MSNTTPRIDHPPYQAITLSIEGAPCVFARDEIWLVYDDHDNPVFALVAPIFPSEGLLVLVRSFAPQQLLPRDADALFAAVRDHCHAQGITTFMGWLDPWLVSLYPLLGRYRKGPIGEPFLSLASAHNYPPPSYSGGEFITGKVEWLH